MKMGLTNVRAKCQSIVNELHAVVSGVVPRRALDIVTFSIAMCQLVFWVLLIFCLSHRQSLTAKQESSKIKGGLYSICPYYTAWGKFPVSVLVVAIRSEGLGWSFRMSPPPAGFVRHWSKFTSTQARGNVLDDVTFSYQRAPCCQLVVVECANWKASLELEIGGVHSSSCQSWHGWAGGFNVQPWERCLVCAQVNITDIRIKAWIAWLVSEREGQGRSFPRVTVTSETYRISSSYQGIGPETWGCILVLVAYYLRN